MHACMHAAEAAIYFALFRDQEKKERNFTKFIYMNKGGKKK